MGEAKRKAARDASDAENTVPGSHRPPTPIAGQIMEKMLRVLARMFPGMQFTIFVFEPPRPGETFNPRYNYASTVDRPDMVAVLRAFVARNAELGEIDAAMAKPPEGSA